MRSELIALPLKTKSMFGLILLLALSVVLFAMQMTMGSVSIPIGVIADILQGHGTGDANEVIVLESRLPRALTSILASIALSLSGWMMQTLFRNPLAGPSILGISGGASLGVALLIMVSAIGGYSSFQSTWGTLSIAGAAILGSLGVMALLLLVSGKFKDHISLLIFGIMLGHFVGAIESILQFKTTEAALRSYILWGMGSYGNTNIQEIILILCILLPAAAVIFLKKEILNILLMGDEFAKSLGVDTRQQRRLLIFLSGTLAAIVTAYCGPIAFIGLAVPHFARMILKTSHHGKLFFYVILLGAMVGQVSDLLAHQLEIPLNAITSAFGAPVVVAILLAQSKKNYYF